MKTKLAICIPTYDDIYQLRRQINFFINELTDNKSAVKFYISDNNSNDQTKTYLKELSKENPWINIINNEKSIGLINLLYDFLKKSIDVDYFWFVNDDDIFISGVLNEVITILNKNDNIGCIFINSIYFINKNKTTPDYDVNGFIPTEDTGIQYDSFNTLLEVFTKNNNSMIRISAWIIKTEAIAEIEKIGFKELHSTEPFLFVANSINYGKMYIIPHPFLQDGTKLTSTWCKNGYELFKVQFIGLYNSILNLTSIKYTSDQINILLTERTNWMINNNPSYFIRGIFYSIILEFKIISLIPKSLKIRVTGKILAELFKVFFQQLKQETIKVISSLFELKYFLKNKFSKRSLRFNNLNTENPEYIVSLTSFPARINKVYIVIESIFNQKTKPNMIILWLSKEEFRDNSVLPSSLRRLQDRGLCINFVSDNYKPYKKLIYTYSNYPNSNIITVDDDIIYPKSWLEKLIYENKKTPHFIISYLSKKIELIDDNNLRRYELWSEVDDLQASNNNFPIGAYGILYPPNSLHSDLNNSALFTRLCPVADDIWFKAMGMLNNTLSRKMPGNLPQFYQIRKSQNSGLFNSNLCEGRNNEFLKNVFDYYNLFIFYNETK